MRSVIRTGILGAAVAALCAPWLAWAQAADAKDPVTAKLGNSEIRSAALLRLIQAQPAETRRTLRDKPEKLVALVRTEALRKAVIASAKQEGFDKKPEIEIGMQRAAEQTLLDRYLDFKTALDAGFPDAEAVAAAYKANEKAFSVPTRVHLAQILLAVAPDAKKKESERIAARAKEIAALAAGPDADFAALAKQHSEDKPGNEKGGDIGWLDVAKLLPEIRGAVAPLADGGVSKPIRTRFGWQIVKLIERKEAYV
ncbi:MAG: peptidylprolyl isomerase, partial [Rhodocyclales bacterium]|nr:peptidylprolyl isomerase [Rhodocyclales bacterium]